MARTRLRQAEQVKGSFSYNDQLNIGDNSGANTEGQAGDLVGSDNVIVSTTATTIVVAEDLQTLGLNSEDQITISGSTSNDDTYIITDVSFSSPNTTITVNSTGIAGTTLSAGGADGNAQGKVDADKNLARDLNFIRTQLRKLNQKPNWFDEPLKDPVENYELVTGFAISAGTPIILSNSKTFDAGEPYTLKVYVNGVLQLPSTVASNVITVSNDYDERSSTQPVGLGEIGDRITFNYDINPEDQIQLKWTKADS